jgi:hypothetical protein
MSLRRFLTRLIWVCLLPLVALAAYLAFDDVFDGQAEMDLLRQRRSGLEARFLDNSLLRPRGSSGWPLASLIGFFAKLSAAAPLEKTSPGTRAFPGSPGRGRGKPAG